MKIILLIVILFIFGCDFNGVVETPKNTAGDLDHAIYMGNISEVKNIIENGGFDVNAIIENDYKETPIHVAAYYGRVDIIEYLVNKGASIDAETLGGSKTAFLIAIWKRNEDAALLLLKLGANPNINTSAGLSSCEMAIRAKLYNVAKKIPNCVLPASN